MQRTLLTRTTAQETFAALVALVTHPIVIGTLGLLTVVMQSVGTISQQLFYLVLLAVITFLPAALYMFVYFKGDVSEMLEMIDREARLVPYVLMIVGALGAIIVLDQINAPRPIFVMTLVLLANEVILGTINFWTKVSIHTATATFTAMTLGYLASPYWYSFVFLVPLIGWARVLRKRHTLYQVISGTLFAAAITGLVLAFSHRYIM